MSAEKNRVSQEDAPNPDNWSEDQNITTIFINKTRFVPQVQQGQVKMVGKVEKVVGEV